LKFIASRIDKTWPSGGSLVNNKLHVRAINAFCPFCGQRGSFLVGDLFREKRAEIRPTSGKCPTCDEVAFFTFYFDNDPSNQDPSSVTIFPSNDAASDVIEIPDALSEGLKRAIRDAEQCYSAGLYSPALTSAGRALEGILKHLSGKTKRSRNLNDLLKHFAESQEVSAPILALSHAIRKGRNIGAHFDDFVSADRETAAIMLELLRHCISYFFFFTDSARELEEILEAKSAAADLLR
jgi:hypothetical protein